MIPAAIAAFLGICASYVAWEILRAPLIPDGQCVAAPGWDWTADMAAAEARYVDLEWWVRNGGAS